MGPVLTVLLAIGLTLSSSVPLPAAERPMMAPRVPADKLGEARALQSPLPASPDVVTKGKALYEGKGACFNCHGKDGRGNGPAAAGLNPPPRDFRHHGFWRHRTEGEIFWVIKHGIPGTAMVPFGGQLTDEEIWAVIQYERSFAGGRGGPRRGMGGMGPKGCCGPESER
ncbi:MAG: cytochrome c [Nitrospirota bacterium]